MSLLVLSKSICHILERIDPTLSSKLILVVLTLCLSHPLLAEAKNKTPTKEITQIQSKPAHDITFELLGVSGEIQESMLASIETRKLPPSQLTPEKIKSFYETLPDVLKEAAYPFGYFEAEIQSNLKKTYSRLAKQTIWQATLSVQLGRPVKIKSVSLNLVGEGRDNKSLSKAVRNFPIKSGDILNSPQYEENKQKLFELAYEQGFLDAKFGTAEVSVDTQKYTADIKLSMDTGNLYYLGDVTFEQQPPYPLGAKYLKRFIPYYSGARYSPQILAKLQQDLLLSGDFKSVQVTTEKEQAVNYVVPVKVSLVPRKRNRYTFGIGYGTDTQLRGTVNWDRRRINEKGHRISSSAKASSLQQLVQSKYTIPGKHPATDSYNINLGYQETKVGTGDRETALISVDYTKHFRTYWQRIIALSFVHESFQAVEDGVRMDEKTRQLLSPSLTYTKIKKDDPIKPTKGHRLRIDFRGALEELSSSTSYFQSHFQGKILATPTKNIRWIARGELGYTAVEKFNDLPLSQRFLAGGSQSVRGYDFESLGPGRYIGTLSVEHQQRIYGNFFLGTFFDMGNAENDFMPNLKKAAGLSLSWLSPIGTISISAAKPFDHARPSDSKKWLLQFNLGPDI